MAKPCVRNGVGPTRGAASGANTSRTTGFAGVVLRTASGRQDSRRQREERSGVVKWLALVRDDGEGASPHPRELQIHLVSVRAEA